MSNKKVVINKKTNLLEEKTYNYNLQNVKEPQLYREIFDYDNVPKIVFNNRFVPQAMPENIGHLFPRRSAIDFAVYRTADSRLI